MARLILFDAGVIGLMCASDRQAEVAHCRSWAANQAAMGAILLLPDLTDYEVRRGLLAVRAVAKIRRLDDLVGFLTPLRVTPLAWRLAAEFWAILRERGQPTAPPDHLDGDAVLAAVAGTVGGAHDEVIIATTNVGHLGRFPGIDARRWNQI